MSLPPYNDDEIRRLIAGLNKGNPGRDAEAKALLRRILEMPAKSGLSPETLDKAREAVRN